LITKSIRFGGQKALNLAILIITVALGVMVVLGLRPICRWSRCSSRLPCCSHRDDAADRGADMPS